MAARGRALALLLVSAVALGACGTPDVLKGKDGGIPIKIEGVGDVSESNLANSALRQLRDFQERGHRAADAADAVDAMRRHLREEGYAHAKVTWSMLPSEEEIEQLLILVEEGPRTTLGTISFIGNTVYSEARLLEFFRFRGTGLFGRGERLFRLAQVESAAKQVERLYILNGYYRVEVGPPAVKWSEDRTRADVVVPIEEGALYLVESVAIKVEGEGIDGEELRQKLDLENKPFNQRVPAQAGATIRSLLLQEGHQLAEVQGGAEVDDERARARIFIEVTPGPVLTLRNVEVSGNERTVEGFIRDRIDLAPGGVMKQNRIDRALDRLYETGLFASVRVEVKPIEVDSAPPSEADIEVRIEEIPARTVDIEAGYGSYELLRAAVRYRDRNLFGAGRFLEAALKGSFRGYGAEARLVDGYTLGGRNILELNAGYETRDEPSFKRTTTRFSLSLRHELDDEMFIAGGYRFSAGRADDIRADIPESELDGFSISAGLFTTLHRDTRDSILIPTKGTVSEIGAFWSTPALGADLDYVELSGAVVTHFPFGEDTTLALGARTITRHILDDRPTLPIQERLFLGGESSVRSFGQDELGPTDDDDDPVGGLSLLEAHIELRQRLIENLHGALFYDIGTIGDNSFDFGGPYGHAIGVGLRYYLPIGPVRLDFGWNPGRRFAADSSWALHFSFGFSF